MKKQDKLYKYRSLRNLCLIRDILENGRLWASDFEELNDPMEGVFYYDVGDFAKDRIKEILNEKKKTRITSLSEDSENELMWTFYADNDRGIVIEVELDELGISDELTRVKYIKQNEFREEDGTNVDAKYLLMRKLPEWKYEKEWRVLTESQFVRVKVTGIIREEKADTKTIKDLQELIRGSNPAIRIENRKTVWLSSKSKSVK